jgi:hypothetical protein
MKTGNGKIANLPSEIRGELNRRINDGDEGRELVECLNAKPEVAEVVTKFFDGKRNKPMEAAAFRAMRLPAIRLDYFDSV